MGIGVKKRYLVCLDSDGYSIHILYPPEKWENVTDQLDGRKVGIIKSKSGEVLNSIGEVVEEFKEQSLARVCLDRLRRLREVMDS
jgi:hypothetical protein